VVAMPRVIRNRACMRLARIITAIGPEIEMSAAPTFRRVSFAGIFIEITVSDNLATGYSDVISFRKLLARLFKSAVHSLLVQPARLQHVMWLLDEV
jgi:hypothetical protein